MAIIEVQKFKKEIWRLKSIKNPIDSCGKAVIYDHHLSGS